MFSRRNRKDKICKRPSRAPWILVVSTLLFFLVKVKSALALPPLVVWGAVAAGSWIAGWLDSEKVFQNNIPAIKHPSYRAIKPTGYPAVWPLFFPATL